MTTVVQQQTAPDAIRALDVLPSDYVDVFTVTTHKAGKASPERWARTALDDAPAAGRFIAWQVLLSLQLESQPTPNTLAGWTIVERGENWIRMEASSWFMTANIIFEVSGDRVSFATLIRYDNPIARVIWTPVSAIHRRIAPRVLYRAVRHIDRDRR